MKKKFEWKELNLTLGKLTWIKKNRKLYSRIINFFTPLLQNNPSKKKKIYYSIYN